MEITSSSCRSLPSSSMSGLNVAHVPAAPKHSPSVVTVAPKHFPPRPSPPLLPQPLRVGVIAWAKVKPPRLNVVQESFKDVRPTWAFFVIRYLSLHYSHHRTTAMQHQILQCAARALHSAPSSVTICINGPWC